MERIRSLAAAALVFISLAATAATPPGSTAPLPAALSWAPVSSGTAGGPDVNYTALINGGGRFIAVGQTQAGMPAVVESADGLTWTGVYTGTSSGTLTTAAYGKGAYVAIGGSEVLSSADGLNWNMEPSLPADASSDLAFGNGSFVVLADCPSNCTSLTSTNGASWSSHPVPKMTVLAYDGTRFVSIGKYDTLKMSFPIYTSCDGINWIHSADLQDDNSTSSFSRISTTATGLIALGKAACVADDPISCAGVSIQTLIAAPKDASHWRVIAVPVDVTITDVTSADGGYYAAAQVATGSGNVGAVMRSPDAVTWSFVSAFPASFTPTAVAADGSHLVIAGNDGDIFTAAASGGGSTPTGGSCSALPSLDGSKGSLDPLTLAGLLGLLFLRRRRI